MGSVTTMTLPPGWADTQVFENALIAAGDPLGRPTRVFRVNVPKGCKVMVDAAVKILCLAQQLAARRTAVAIRFDEGEEGAMGYLNRLGFFDQLGPQVTIEPARPSVSGAQVHRGGNAHLVEIARLRPGVEDQALPSRLADVLSNAVRVEKRGQLSMAAFTVFAELIQNVYLHSQSQLDGYATLQVYKNKAKVVVSDSGVGLLHTLRPSLAAPLRGLSDTDLMVQAFRSGLSSQGPGRGCGLKTSAAHAIKYQARLDVRLSACRIHLVPSRDGYQPNVAHCAEGLPKIGGTHIAFDFSL